MTYLPVGKKLPKPPRIYIVGPLEDTAKFYQQFERLMEQLYPDPFYRPIVYVQASSNPELHRDYAFEQQVKPDMKIVLGDKDLGTHSVEEIFTHVAEASGLQQENIPGLTLVDNSSAENPFKQFGFNIIVGEQLQAELQASVSEAKGPPPTIINLVGGMGTTAGADFMGSVVENAKEHIDSKKDQSNNPQGVVVTLYSNPAFLRPGEDGFKNWIFNFSNSRSVMNFRNGLKEYFSLPGQRTYSLTSNTAHKPSFFSMCKGFLKSTATLFHMVENVAKNINNQNLNKQIEEHDRIVILATTQAVQAGLYPAAFANKECKGQIIHLSHDSEQQQKVQDAIYEIKHGHVSEAQEKLMKIIYDLCASTGARSIMLCCTEFPVAIDRDFISKFNTQHGKNLGGDVTFVNATDLAAKELVTRAFSPAPAAENSPKKSDIFRTALDAGSKPQYQQREDNGPSQKRGLFARMGISR